MQGKNIVIGALIAILCAILGWFFFLGGEDKITNFPPQGQTIVAFGDSLVSGVGATAGNDFVSRLAYLSGEQIINMGVPGATTADGLNQVTQVNSQDPKIVLLLLGGNDFLRHVPLAETFDNLDKIVRALQAEGAVVIILGVRGGILSDSYREHFENLAISRGAFYVPNVLDGIIGDADLMSDSIHPNDLGHEKIAGRIYPIFLKALNRK